MRAAEFIRALADIIDNLDSNNVESAIVHPSVELIKVDEPATHSEPDSNGIDSNFVPPLQAKLELLKKSVGVPNHYDQDSDEIDVIKKNAGIAAFEASDDEPLD